MRLCLVLSRLANGGLERVQINLANAFLAAGHDAEMVVGHVSHSPYPALMPEVPVREVAPRGPWQFVFGLAGYLLRERPDWVLTTSNDIACFALMLRPLVSPATRIMVTQHLALSAPLEHARGARRLKTAALYRIMHILLPHADSRIAVSRGVAADMSHALSIGSDSVSVIYNPIVDSQFTPLSREPISWPWPADGIPTIIFVGRLSPEKRLDLLLQASLPLLQSGQARLLIVGSGPLSSWLGQQLNLHGLHASCHCTGFVHNILPYVSHSDVLVLPSDYEGFGNVLVEAMACGVQVVSTDCPHGPREILQDGTFGQLVPVGDTEALRQAILNAIHGHFHVPAVTLRYRASDFSIEAAVCAYSSIINEPTRSTLS